MVDGIIENRQDALWLRHSGFHEGRLVDAFVAGLAPVALWYAYELARNPNADDLAVNTNGYLLIQLNDDYHPPGLYHYKRRAESDDAARALVLERFGKVVRLPLGAVLSEQEVQA